MAECCINYIQHKDDERGAIGIGVSLFEGLVVAVLLIFNQAFDGQQIKEVIPLTEDEGLPEAAHASVAVGEGVDEFEFVVKDTAGDEGMVVGGGEPVE